MPCIVRWPGRIPAGIESSALTTAMDLYPTIAGWCGADTPTDRTIDGRDISPILLGENGAASPHQAFFYYAGPNLEAVRAGRWKLHVHKTPGFRGGEGPMEELYDLAADIGETNDVAATHPEIVAELHSHLDRARRDLGDGLSGAEGVDRRPVGRVDDPVPLTTFDPHHPYYMAEYDLADRG